MNPYDGKAFFIDYLNPDEPGAGSLWPVDGSINPARIRGWSLTGRYTLDPKNTGKMEDYVQGPYCAKADVFEAEGKRGEQDGTEAGTIPVWTHEDGTPWTAQECVTCPLPGGPVRGGPNAAPPLSPQEQAFAAALAAESSANEQPAAPPASQPADGRASTPAAAPSIPDHADSLFARIRNKLTDDWHAAEGEAFTLLADFERTFEKLRAHL